VSERERKSDRDAADEKNVIHESDEESEGSSCQEHDESAIFTSDL
jgi:hypothetical protein